MSVEEGLSMKINSFIVVALIAVQSFSNNMNTGGLSGVNKTYSAYSIGRGSFDLGLTIKGEYGNEALHDYTGGGADLKDVALFGQDLFFAYGITNWMDIAVDMPLYEDMIDGFDGDAVGLGDLSASIKLMHPGMKSDALIRLAYIFRATLPTAMFDKGYYAREPQFASVSESNTGGAYTSGGYNLNPLLAWTFDLTRLKKAQPWLVHVNFGMDALFYPDEKDNRPAENTAMQGGLAVEWLCSPTSSVFLDFYGKSRLGNITDGPFLKIFAKDQLTLALGTKKQYESGLNVAFVVEGALSTQSNFTKWSTKYGEADKVYGTQPTPILGAALTLGFGKKGKRADSDFDNNPNITDKCPQDAEDYDGYEDEDGCPDLIHKVEIATPRIDTVILTQKDTITIVKSDTVRIVRVDTLQYQAAQDPNQAINFGKTTFPAVTFNTGSDELKKSSYKTLNDIALSLKNFPTVTLQILGYTDNVGTADMNKTLSSKRAQAVVNYLTSQGIEAVRLEAQGLGLEDPVSNNNTAEGRSLNRRVEFKRLK